MNDKDLTPRVLAGLALGEDPSKFMSFRLMPDGERGYASVVVIDPVGRKFILTAADLARVFEEVTNRRLKARSKALVDDLKNGVPGIPPVPASAAPTSEPKPKVKANYKPKTKAAAKPKPTPKPKTKKQ